MKLVIPGDPISKMRARFYKGACGIHSYDPQHIDKNNTKNHMLSLLKKAMNSNDKKEAMDATDLSSSSLFSIDMVFYLPISKSQSGPTRKKKLWGLEKCNIKPDIDNLEKFYLDCANGILFPDDRMIISLRSKKLYSDKPRTEINILPIKELSLPDKAKQIITIFEPDELKQFLYDLRCFNRFNVEDIDALNDKDKEKWFFNMARQLAFFARKHGESIKKINKHKDFECEQSIEDFMEEIHKGFSNGKTLC